VQKDVLVREHGADASPFFQMGILTGLPDFNRIAQHELPRIFKTGEGLEYDQLGDQTACGVCRELGVWLRHALVPSIKTMPSVAEKLEQGCLVADVGCGAGVAMFVAAEAFPASTFHGFDISEKALALARAEKERRGCKNVEFFNPSLDEDRMGTGKYDFVMTHDAIHDMAHPQQVMENVHKAMKPGAEWIIGDMSSLEDHGQNIHNHPFSANLYGFSCLCCLPSGMSAPGAAGLGTMGLSIPLAEKMLKTAGFKDFKVLEWTHPLNRYYVAVA
jgi:SAM-dependent methyltransferase